jgi:hypothetical protein
MAAECRALSCASTHSCVLIEWCLGTHWGSFALKVHALCTRNTARDFKLLPRCACDLRCFEILCSQAVQGFSLGCLTLEDGTNRFSRNVSKNCQSTLRNFLKERRSQQMRSFVSLYVVQFLLSLICW